MQAERWKRIESICLLALERPPSERSVFLDGICENEPSLRSEVDSLISLSSEADDFLETPATGLAEAMFAEDAADNLEIPVANVPDPLLGTIVSHYRLLELLGRGGMGIVYKAEDLKLGRLLALKFLPEVSRQSQSFLLRTPEEELQSLRRVELEARACSALDHPNICTIYEIDEYDGTPFIAMQLLQGETLREIIGSRSLTTSEVLKYGLQIADALRAAHSAGILHCDIKPANVFITQRSEVKILDFGLAKLTNRNHFAAVTRDGKPETTADETFEKLPSDEFILGTASYMSPEQAMGKRVDERSDLFSLGALLYEMATGHQAFPGDNPIKVFTAMFHRSPTPPSLLNNSVPSSLEKIILRALQKDPEHRYQTAQEIEDDLRAIRHEQPEVPAKRFYRAPALRLGILCLIAVSAVMISFWFFYWGGPLHPRLREDDSLLIADFSNTTGDTVFDETLKQALYVQMEQSPYLNVVPEGKARATLRFMGMDASKPISGETAREVCLRTASKVMLAGSIAPLGSHYVLGISVINCQTGEAPETEQSEVNSREEVLSTLGSIATKLRRRMGESMASIGKYDVPLEQVTTPSLEALQAYSLGTRTSLMEGDAAATAFFKHATEIDPNFAMAYAQLSQELYSQGEVGTAITLAEKAFNLRNHVSERERLSIESEYYMITSQDDKAIQSLEVWHKIYPRDLFPIMELGLIDSFIGQHERSVAAETQAIHLSPNNGIAWSILANSYSNLNRFNEARATLEDAQKRRVPGLLVEGFYYVMAFLDGNSGEMDRELKAGMSQEGREDWFLATEADTEAYSGHLVKARELTRRAITSARRHNNPEAAAGYQVIGALREAAFGNPQAAQKEATESLGAGSGIPVRTLVALAFAQSGAPEKARELVADLQHQYPLDTLLKGYWLPSIAAEIELDGHASSRAVDLLLPAEEYELGVPKNPTNAYPYPIYIRGKALLASGKGSGAAIEFQKIISHPGIVGNYPLGALAHLGLARAYAIEAGVPILTLHKESVRGKMFHIDSARPDRLAMAKNEYQTFLTLWKNADPDIPILQEATLEYKSLQ